MMPAAKTLPAPPLPQTAGTFETIEDEQLKPSRGTGSRAGKKCAPIWLSEAAKRQLDLMSVEEDITLQQLLTEGVNLVFAKYGRPTIA